MSYIIGIECSTTAGGVALAKDGRVVAAEEWSRQSSHGEFVVPAIHKILHSEGISTEQLGRVAVDIGPGRFTGVRIAVNVARAISFAQNIELVTANSLQILCENVEAQELPLLAILNAHKNMVFAAIFEPANGKWECKLEPQALTQDRLEKQITRPHICVGEGFSAYEKEFSPTLKQYLLRKSELDDYPKVQVLTRLAEGARPKSWNEVIPLYIRASEAEERLKTN